MKIEIQQMHGGSHHIGSGGTIINQASSTTATLGAAVDELIALVRAHSAALAEPVRAETAALAAGDEARRAAPRRERLLARLTDLSAAARDVSAISTATLGVIQLVRALP